MFRSSAFTGNVAGIGNNSFGGHSPLLRHGVNGFGSCPRGPLSYAPETVSSGLQTVVKQSSQSNTGFMSHAGPQIAIAAAPHTGLQGLQETEGVVWRQDFDARFSLGEVIGEGQQGVVCEVVERETSDVLAVKIVLKDVGAGLGNGMGEKKVRAEANFLKELQDCPAVARLRGAYEDEEHVYIVMERFDGGSIEDKLETMGHFEELEVAELMRAVFGFLAHSHKRSVCYGDVKPANLMLGSLGENCLEPCTAGRLKGLSVKAIDFGCCQRAVPGVPFRRRSGSPLYMAPEIFLGRYGVEVDLWSAGVMMYQLISGKMPFAEYDEAGEIVEVGLHFGYSFDDEPWEAVSSELKDLISRLLVRTPRKRISAEQALRHSWFTEVMPHLQESDAGKEASSIVAAPANLTPAPPVATAV